MCEGSTWAGRFYHSCIPAAAQIDLRNVLANPLPLERILRDSPELCIVLSGLDFLALRVCS